MKKTSSTIKITVSILSVILLVSIFIHFSPVQANGKPLPEEQIQSFYCYYSAITDAWLKFDWISYFSFDIDHDGTEELFLQHPYYGYYPGECYPYSVYGIKNGTLCYYDILGSDYASCYIDPKTKQMLRQQIVANRDLIEEVNLVDGKIVYTTIYDEPFSGTEYTHLSGSIHEIVHTFSRSQQEKLQFSSLSDIQKRIVGLMKRCASHHSSVIFCDIDKDGFSEMIEIDTVDHVMPDKMQLNVYEYKNGTFEYVDSLTTDNWAYTTSFFLGDANELLLYDRLGDKIEGIIKLNDNQLSLEKRESTTLDTTYHELEKISLSLFEYPSDTELNALTTDPQTGDVDWDSKVTSADARLVLRASVRLERLDPDSVTIADIDNDGKVTASDARYILRMSVGLEDQIEGQNKNEVEKSIEEYCQLYKPVLDTYIQFVQLDDSERIDFITSNNLSILARKVKTIGYYLIDIDHNGTKELIIGSPEMPFYNIFELYTLSDNSPLRIIDSFERSSYHLRPDLLISYHGSGGATFSYHDLFGYQNGELIQLDSTYYPNQNNKWFGYLDELELSQESFYKQMRLIQAEPKIIEYSLIS